MKKLIGSVEVKRKIEVEVEDREYEGKTYWHIYVDGTHYGQEMSESAAVDRANNYLKSYEN